MFCEYLNKTRRFSTMRTASSSVSGGNSRSGKSRASHLLQLNTTMPDSSSSKMEFTIFCSGICKLSSSRREGLCLFMADTMTFSRLASFLLFSFKIFGLFTILSLMIEMSRASEKIENIPSLFAFASSICNVSVFPYPSEPQPRYPPIAFLLR